MHARIRGRHCSGSLRFHLCPNQPQHRDSCCTYRHRQSLQKYNRPGKRTGSDDNPSSRSGGNFQNPPSTSYSCAIRSSENTRDMQEKLGARTRGEAWGGANGWERPGAIGTKNDMRLPYYRFENIYEQHLVEKLVVSDHANTPAVRICSEGVSPLEQGVPHHINIQIRPFSARIWRNVVKPTSRGNRASEGW